MYNALAEMCVLFAFLMQEFSVYKEEINETREQLRLDDLFGTNYFSNIPKWLQIQFGIIQDDTPKMSQQLENPDQSVFLFGLPRNVIPKILQYVPAEGINNLKQVSKDTYKQTILNWKLLDRETIKEFSLSRSTPSSYMQEILEMKTPLRSKTCPTYRQDVFYVRIDCDTGKKYWWNYVLKDLGAGDEPEDFINPVSYKRKNVSIPVWDMRLTLQRHIEFFFQQCKIENFKIEDFNAEDLKTLINVVKKTKLLIHRLTISLEAEDFYQGYVDFINLIKPRELNIVMFNKTIPRSFWTSPVIYSCNVLRLRGFNPCQELNDEILFKLKATKLHLIGISSVTAVGLHELIKKWNIREREFHSIYVMNRISPTSLMENLKKYLTLGLNKMAVHRRESDNKLLYIGAERDLFVMSTVPRAYDDYDGEMSYLGGHRCIE